MIPYVTGDRFETNDSCRPGSPNPTRNATMMIGVPRKKSVYATAKTRNGAAPRPGRPRTMAMPRASTRTSVSAITIIRMFTWKPAQTSGSASLKLCGLKNLSRTSRRAFISSLLQYGHLREVDREPLLLQLRDRPVRPQRLDCRVDHRLQLRALLEHRAVLLVRDDLSRDGAVLAGARLPLARDDRRVEDQCVALVDLHGGERGGRRRIGERRLRRMELRLDPVEAGRVRLRAGLHLLQVREAVRRRRLLREQHALVRVEVARREVDGPLALRGDRRLLERDVELLRAGSEEAVPRREDPVDLADLQVRGDRFREIDLVALRVRDLVAADGAAGKADRGIAEGDREGAGVERRGCRRSGSCGRQFLKVADQALAALEHDPLRERARFHPSLDALDEQPVLLADLVVELQELGDPALVGVRREEVVEEPRAPAGRQRVDRPDRDVRAPREDVDPGVRPQEVELAARDLAGDVEVLRRVLAHRPELRRDETARLEPVRVEPDVDDVAEARVRDLAVVALEEVLADDLPVRVQLPLDAVAERERVDVEDLGDEFRHLAESLGERRRVGVEVDEDERPPRVDLHRHETEALLLESRLGLRARRREQAAVQSVRPCVVRALQRRSATLALGDREAAVPADVHEGPQLPVLARACNDYRSHPDLGREERAAFRKLPHVSDVLPMRAEDPLLLAVQRLGIG